LKINLSLTPYQPVLAIDCVQIKLLCLGYTEYTIVLTWDNEASVWIAENDNIPIALESDSIDTLIERVRNAVPELLELNGKNHANTALRFVMERQTVLA
jgi:hypothetical protein